MFDAPISGGVSRAAFSQLTVIAGGIVRHCEI